MLSIIDRSSNSHHSEERVKNNFPFPLKLYDLLESCDNNPNIIQALSSGTADKSQGIKLENDVIRTAIPKNINDVNQSSSIDDDRLSDNSKKIESHQDGAKALDRGICWTQNGSAFQIYDQVLFSNILLKHFNRKSM